MDKKDIVHILWVDPHSQDEWTSVDDINDSQCIISTVGILIRENKRCYVVTLNYNFEEKDASCTIIIPKVCVVKFKKTGTISEPRLPK